MITNKDVNNYVKEIENGISELVKQPTVYDSTTVSKAMPYGKSVFDGYSWMKAKALQDGFDVLEYDGHALAIRMKSPKGQEPNSKDRIDILAHLDVVEPGNGWDEDPFSGKITRFYIHGRGTQDMKGSLMIAYYVLKYIKDKQISLKREIRLVVGCDEERTMEDMHYYIRKTGEPAFAFTPDGAFPFSLGEKGALMWHVEGTADSCIQELYGGVQCNVVSPKVTALLKNAGNYEGYRKEFIAAKYRGEIKKEEEYIRITILGKAAHASRPECGKNATILLLDLIRKVSKDRVAELIWQCFSDYNGKGCGIDYEIAPMGKLTLNLGILEIQEGRITADIDCRYPKGVTAEKMTKQIQNVLEPLKIELKYDDKPTLADENSPFINGLLHSYRKVTGDDKSEPLISGGVTYSKAVKNCVAFGPLMKGDKSLAHQANEKIKRGNLKKLFEIYTETVIELGNIY